MRMRSEFQSRGVFWGTCISAVSAVMTSNPGLCIEASVAVTLRTAGNGDSTNGSSDTPHRPRKRQRHPENWKRAVAKAKRAKGEAYVSPNTGKAVSGRTTGPDCRCRRKCFQRLTTEEKAQVLEAFNQLANKDLQDAHLFGLIQPLPVKRRRPRTASTPARVAAYTYSVSYRCVFLGMT